MSNLNNSYHRYYSQIGGSDFANSLPFQTIPKAKKNESWKKDVMNRLEEIGIVQVSRNLVFRDFYKMTEGRLIYQDFDETLATTERIAEFREEAAGLPTYLKHFDIIGRIVNQISGELDNQKERIRVDSVDPFSQAEYYREKNTQVKKYAGDFFQLELKRLLILKGVNPEKQDFQSEEERQQYAQQLKKEQDDLISPTQIESTLKKSFRAQIAEWAEHTLESDYIKYDLADWDLEEFVDYLLTGRYFRHYHIGHDHYLPERWSPIDTFFSQDVNLVFPQDGEYVGRINFMSGADVLQRYGHLLPEKFTKKLYGYTVQATKADGITFEQALKKGFSETHITPYKSYYEHDLAYRFQSATGLPMGNEHRYGEDGELESRVSFLDETYASYGYVGNRFAQYLRDDVDVRTDLLQVTEAYWRSYKMVGLLTVPHPLTSEPYQVIVEEDLLKEYLVENDIKQLRTIPLKKAKKDKELNTIAWFYVPQVWGGKKVSGGNSNLIDDYWFDIEPLPYQIKGNSNLFDVKLPVAGLITSSIAQKIRPYQVEHNIHMNMIRNATEKHIGAFLMFDFNFLPAQYKGEFGEDTRELIQEFTQNIRDIGIGFYDSSPGNTKGANPNANVIQKQSIDFIQDMQYHAQMADLYERKAFEQIGITPQRMGTPSEYMTAEGIKQGVDASYAQTERIFRRFNTAKRKEAEIHLNIAQYAVKDNKDIVVDYVKPDEGRIIKKFTDEDFYLRKINVIPINDSAQRKNLESFRQFMMQNNTANNDLLDFAKIFTTKSFKSLMEYAQISRERQQREIQEQRQHEQSIAQQNLQAEALKAKEERDFEASENQKDRENKLREAEIHGIARAADNNADLAVIKQIQAVSNENIKNEQNDKKLAIQEREIERKEKLDESLLQNSLKELNLKMQELKLRKQEDQTKRFTSIINKN